MAEELITKIDSIDRLVCFQKFSKIPRFRREVEITEKIDGTNAHINIVDVSTFESSYEISCLPKPLTRVGNYMIYAGSRHRYIYPGKTTDNYEFATWVKEHAGALVSLGAGRHYGEWWGRDISRGYGISSRYFSLFNTDALQAYNLSAIGVRTVPVLCSGVLSDGLVEDALDILRYNGSRAVDGYYGRPEGIVIRHIASGHIYKLTLEDDELPKTTRG